MNYHIIQNLPRSHHQSPVKIQISCSAAAAPSCFLIPYGNPSIRNLHSLRIQDCPFSQQEAGPLTKALTFFLCQFFCRKFPSTGSNLLLLCPDPMFFFPYKILYFSETASFWRPDNYASVRLYLNCNCFPPGSYKLIFHISSLFFHIFLYFYR